MANWNLCFFSGRLVSLAAFVLVTPLIVFGKQASAQVIASCGSMEGYSYYHQNELVGPPDSGWTRESLTTTTIFLGRDQVADVILVSSLNGEEWTRSASDYNAPVVEVAREGAIRHILVLWGLATELYALDTEKNTLSLVALKSGVVEVTRAFIGKCE